LILLFLLIAERILEMYVKCRLVLSIINLISMYEILRFLQILPKNLEPLRVQFGVTGSMLNIFVPKICMDGPGV